MQQSLFKNTEVEKPEAHGGQVQRLVSRFPDYIPYPGFYDLRCFDMPIKTFKSLWKIQDFLFHVNENKKYYQKWHQRQWQEAQEMSAEYQRILFQYEG